MADSPAPNQQAHPPTHSKKTGGGKGLAKALLTQDSAEQKPAPAKKKTDSRKASQTRVASNLGSSSQPNSKNSSGSPQNLAVPQSTVPAWAQTLALSASTAAAYIWLSIPVLRQFTLQAFALCFLLYFILKKINQAQISELLPTTAVDEMVLALFAGLILIGSTNGSNSYFFPLVFVLLFLVSMTMQFSTSIIISLEFLLFFYASSSGIAQLNYSTLLSIPLVMTFFLFAKHQYNQAKEKQALVEIESNEIHHYQVFLEAEEEKLTRLQQNSEQISQYFVSFLKDYLQPKLIQLQNMADFDQNSKAVKGQLALLYLQIEKVVDSLGKDKPKEIIRKGKSEMQTAQPTDKQS